mmetsp:Transcript_27785/g.64177  ORF Transcript_27785/g.64177 Transcript_27785/m.64177 type:complete len:314 (-) Transcript_27785:106-1047(-)|eukprot:284631-Amphidinium_carterae.1
MLKLLLSVLLFIVQSSGFGAALAVTSDDHGGNLQAAPPVLKNMESSDVAKACPGGSCASCFAGGLCLGAVGTTLLIMVLGEACGRLRLRGAAAAPDSAPLEVPSEQPEATQVTSPSASKEEDHHSATETIESMHLFWPRLSCLIVLLLVQSVSSVILEGFQGVFTAHPSILHFLTMLVGTGGNCGGQSVVLAVRRLAVGEDVDHVIVEQALIGMCLAAVLAPLAFVRSWFQNASLLEAGTIAAATAFLVVFGTSLGAALPKLFAWVRVDPAHATPSIQVAMDIVGVSIVCVTTWLFLSQAPTAASLLGFLHSA